MQAQGEDGLWYTIAKTASLTNGTYGFSSTYGFPIGIVDALGLLPSSLGGTIKNLQGGNYRIIGTTNEVVNGWGHLDVGFTTSPKAIPNVYKPEAGGPVTGNVITDDSFHDADPDQDALGVPPAKLQIQQADGTFVNANGNVVEGQYGKLTIDANGATTATR